MRSWAAEFGRHNIRVNDIAPGLIKTDFSAYFWQNEEHAKRVQEMQPIGRIGDPDEIAGLALFLASDHASFITGQSYIADGGASTR